jgi:hypothetical protein
MYAMKRLRSCNKMELASPALNIHSSRITSVKMTRVMKGKSCSKMADAKIVMKLITQTRWIKHNAFQKRANVVHLKG